jgi:type II secretory pathway pseudopilin PulG
MDTNDDKVGAIDRNRLGGLGKPPLPESHLGVAPYDPNEGGFTLAELLIAAGITVVIVVMLGWMLGSMMSAGSRATQRVDAFRDARAALQMMERDLRNLVPNQWDSKTPPNAITLPAAYFALKNVWQDDPNNDPYSANNPNAQLFALISAQNTTSSSCSSIGDVCAVGYYCRWDNQLHAYSLRRFFSDSCTTFNVIQGAGSYAEPSVLYTPGPNDAVLAAYIWNFKITMYNSTGAVINTYPYICDPNSTSQNTLPAAIEISFNAMSPKAAQAVMSVPSPSARDWMDTTRQNYQGLVAPHAYQFRSRINLP